MAIWVLTFLVWFGLVIFLYGHQLQLVFLCTDQPSYSGLVLTDLDSYERANKHTDVCATQNVSGGCCPGLLSCLPSCCGDVWVGRVRWWWQSGVLFCLAGVSVAPARRVV